MSAVMGEATYEALTFPNQNQVGDVFARGDGSNYCSGCNGNFSLGFDSTSFSENGGVFGVSLDIVFHTSRRVSLGDDDPSNPTYEGSVEIQFADGSIEQIWIPADIGYYEPSIYFLGITDERGIASITIGTEPTAKRHSWVIDNLTVAASPVLITPALVAIDIKPGSDPNCFNINGHGVIPVAILGDEDFDVTEIDLVSLSFGGLEVRMRGNKGPLCTLDYSNEDAYLDLVCHFEDDSSAWEIGDGEATLTGNLIDDTPFEGTDSICVVP